MRLNLHEVREVSLSRRNIKRMATVSNEQFVVIVFDVT